MSISLDSRHVINKIIMTSDGITHEYVVSQSDKDITVVEGVWRTRKYVIPKSLITSFDGSIVRLSISENELGRYLAK